MSCTYIFGCGPALCTYLSCPLFSSLVFAAEVPECQVRASTDPWAGAALLLAMSVKRGCVFFHSRADGQLNGTRVLWHTPPFPVPQKHRYHAVNKASNKSNQGTWAVYIKLSKSYVSEQSNLQWHGTIVKVKWHLCHTPFLSAQEAIYSGQTLNCARQPKFYNTHPAKVLIFHVSKLGSKIG